MFNANFSFGTADPLVATESTSTDISPYTSRCSSPRLENVGPRSEHRRDSRYDSWRSPRHPSVTALTTQLEHHAIVDELQLDSPGPMMSPSDLNYDNDEGFCDGPNTPASSCSDESTEFDPALWDLSAFDYSATSSPRPSLSLEAQASSAYTMRRRQRQALVRLQCLAKRAPDVAMLLEECHPSSLPLSNEAPWLNHTSRSNSAVSLSGYKIEKQRSETISTRRAPKMRKRTK
jgi:hypothetical protein